MSTYTFRWDVVRDNLPFLLSGLQSTLVISAITLMMAMLGGLVLVSLDLSRWRLVRSVSIMLGELVRNTPILIQLLWYYYVLPISFGVDISPMFAAILGLSIYSSAFIGEVYRAGIQGIPKGHVEAARVLGLSRLQTFTRIVLPQAFWASLPPLASNFVMLIKYSSLASVLSVPEITRRATELSSSTFRPLEIFTAVAVAYFVICWPLTLTIRWIERRTMRLRK
ncbi:amino acid ABC transporter permease [Variovorax sp. EL159]|uniref:amino acid ABC transporter permease n=1 Tax=Variovorax sp. EL159 TaxID=1566270 RepID=UPI0008804274|nr:amino acid ABC transporter permease [Variovorax sp. EL159]SCX71593.1 amino acid ABC transporter membrane protein, PAAT family (TC 3.A.1.3.-) [Variovorax sp. EL159]